LQLSSALGGRRKEKPKTGQKEEPRGCNGSGHHTYPQQILNCLIARISTVIGCPGAVMTILSHELTMTEPAAEVLCPSSLLASFVVRKSYCTSLWVALLQAVACCCCELAASTTFYETSRIITRKEQHHQNRL
jgi:hypothetical protein